MVAAGAADSEKTPTAAWAASTEKPTADSTPVETPSGKQRVPASILLAGTNNRYGAAGQRLSRCRSGGGRNSLVGAADALKAGKSAAGYIVQQDKARAAN